jgi:hypothetical protein
MAIPDTLDVSEAGGYVTGTSPVIRVDLIPSQAPVYTIRNRVAGVLIVTTESLSPWA